MKTFNEQILTLQLAIFKARHTYFDLYDSNEMEEIRDALSALFYHGSLMHPKKNPPLGEHKDLIEQIKEKNIKENEH